MWDFDHVIGPLSDPAAHGGDAADAFDVIVPSLPGFGFSSPLRVPGVHYWRVADVWARLMREVLGYARFAAHGADIGALVTAQLGHKYGERLIGIHVCSALTFGAWHTRRPWVDLMAPVFERSPAGRPDELVAWVTQTFASAARYYLEATRNPWVPAHDRTPVVECPTGVSMFAANNPPGFDGGWVGSYYNLTLYREHARGGHFPSIEQPQRLVEDLRDTFRPLRSVT